MRALQTMVMGIALLSVGAADAQLEPRSGTPPRGGPPPEAFAACSNKPQEAVCSFRAPHGSVEGTCRVMRRELVCVPESHGMRSRPGDGRAPQREGLLPGEIDTQPVRQGRPVGYQPNPPYANAKVLNNKVPDTGQVSCFSNQRVEACGSVRTTLKGQDGHYRSRLVYRNNRDGTVTDRVTGLTWQQAHNEQRLTFGDAAAACGRLALAGHRDWRLPTITELFSISHWQGVTGQRYFIDTRYFELKEPGQEILAGDPFRATHHTAMMGQTWSSTEYVGRIALVSVKHVFFFNFLDGRIKSAPKQGRAKLFHRCVRGEPWGNNAFQNNRNGTVTDRATDLMWQQADDGRPRDWSQSLAYCENLTLAGYRDWRLPNVKELQTLVDYRRYDPAIDTAYFSQKDKRGWFWSSTTHGDDVRMADYVCFGECTSVDGEDVHGAGAQRSDPKSGNPSRWGARGGQRDETRIYNYARCVRDAG